MKRIKPVRPVNGNDHHRIGSSRRIVAGFALAMLMSVVPVRAEIMLSTPTKLSLSPLPAPPAIANDHFSLAVEPWPRSSPATNGISAVSSDATRRGLEAAAFLNNRRVAGKGSGGGLFSTQVGDRGFRIANIQAGYGMVCMDPVFRRGRNGTAMEEPSFFFLKTSLKF